MFPSTICLLAAVFSAVQVWPYDISSPLDPKGKLGVTLDLSLALTSPQHTTSDDNALRNWVYSSHLIFNGSISDITDGQLWQIATDAFQEMQDDAKQYKIGDKQGVPQAMSILAWDNQIILASSQINDNSFTKQYKDTKVLPDLQICQQVWGHLTSEKCAQPMTAQIYYTIDVEDLEPLSDFNARIGTVVDQDNNGKPVPTSPCPADGTEKTDSVWGCNLFLTTQNLKVLDTGTALEGYKDVNTLSGGVAVRDQVQLCSKVRGSTFPTTANLGRKADKAADPPPSPPEVVIPDITQEDESSSGDLKGRSRGIQVKDTALVARAGPLPLVDPSAYPDQDQFVRTEAEKKGTQQIYLYPSDTQVENFKKRVPSGGRAVPVGATGNFWKFSESERITWGMLGLEGCTAMFAVSKEGLWAGHLWELSNGIRTTGTDYGTYLYYPNAAARDEADAGGKETEVERSDADFKVVAADILAEATNPDAKADTWLSFADLRAKDAGVFSNGGDGSRLHILTVAKGLEDDGQQYETKIKILQDGFRAEAVIPNAQQSTSTYVSKNEDGYVTKFSTGVVLVQYTPNQGDGKHAVKVWVEDEKEPRIDMTW